MRFLRQSLSGLLLLSLTLGLLAYAGQTVMSAVQERMAQDGPAPDRKERIFGVTITRATAKTITPMLETFGEVHSRRTLEIRAKTSGTIVELAENFQDGGQVEGGQFLALIDPADAQSALDRSQSDLLDAGAELREAETARILAKDELAAAQDQAALRARAFERQQDLEERGVGTAATVENAELAAAQARQAVLASRQALALAEARIERATTKLSRAKIASAEAQRRLDDTRVSAGFSGILSDVTVVEGGLVSQNERLAQLIDGTALEVSLRVSTAQYARLLDSAGQLVDAPVSVTLDAFGFELTTTGRISRASAAVGEGQTGRVIYANLDAAPGFKPGDFVRVSVQEPPLPDAIRLPATALGPGDNVLVLGDKDRLVSVPINLLRRQGDDILVRAPDLDGRSVVAERSPLLGAGIRVRPISPPDAQAVDLIALSDADRARYQELVRSNPDMPEAIKTQLISELDKAQVPAEMIRKLENQTDGS